MPKYNPKKNSNVIIVINNDINKAISKLRHISAPIIKEFKEKQFYEKPSEKRRRLKKEGIANFRKKQRLKANSY